MVQRDQDWLREAEAELGAARDLLGSGHWSWCCFTAQQAAEQALKAVCEHLRAPHFGHNLNVLRQAIEGHVAVAQSVRLACARLNRYYIPTRCPDAFDQGAPADQFFEADARAAVQDTEEVMGFAARLVRPPSSRHS
jgi:HEPN domain-containing protein